MIEFTQLVVFRLDEQRYALRLAAVDRVVRVAEITPLPKAPEVVLGVIDIEGRIIPVLNVRLRFRLPEREITPADHFLIAQTTRRTVALLIDEVQGVIERLPAEIVGATQVVPGLEQIEGVIKFDDGLALIHDLDTFLSLDEAQTLDQAMSQEVTDGG